MSKRNDPRMFLINANLGTLVQENFDLGGYLLQNDIAGLKIEAEK